MVNGAQDRRERGRRRDGRAAGRPRAAGVHGRVQGVRALQVGGEQHVQPAEDRPGQGRHARRRQDQVLQGRQAHLPLSGHLHFQRVHRRPRRLSRQDQPARSPRQGLRRQLRHLNRYAPTCSSELGVPFLFHRRILEIGVELLRRRIFRPRQVLGQR